MTVKPTTKYAASDWYISDVVTSLEIIATNSAGKQTFLWLADAPASATWKQVNTTFTTPADTVKVQLYHALAKKGSLQTDQYVLAESGVAPPPPGAPTISLTKPTANATVSGIQPLEATVSAGVTSVKFVIDGDAPVRTPQHRSG